MYVIYEMLNTVNGKRYIGQTNNFKQRMRAHRSDANNQNSHSYNTPLSNAIRKYGWEKFKNTIIEEIDDEESREFIVSREIFFIEHFDSLTSRNGYNITLGGQGRTALPHTYEEKLKMSKIFTPEEIMDIQDMLSKGIARQTILLTYPRLTTSFLDNINLGYNFKNDEWEYPLHAYSKDGPKSDFFTKEQMQEIKQDIINGMLYKDIAAKWNISMGMVSGINNGKVWHEEERTYPLKIKNTSRLHNANTWVKDVQYELMHNPEYTMVEIAKRYNKAYSTIKKINSGASHRNDEYTYPLRK